MKMEQSEGGGGSALRHPPANPPPPPATTEIPAKKLAKQLDFTAISAPAPANGFGSQAASPFQSQSQPQQQNQDREEDRKQRVAAPSPMQPSVDQRTAQSLMRAVKLDSPRSRSRPVAEVKDGTPKRAKHCNCQHSRCLKLYCECFASGVYCQGCNCVNCFNNVENDAARREAVEATLERNPNAFRPKMASSQHGHFEKEEDAREVVARYHKGCHCKKSGCLKKYCECFQANILCSETCKCIDCKNFEGSEERQALYRDHGNNIAYIQQAANAAISGAIGSSGFMSAPASKKRKGQDLNFPGKDPSFFRQVQFSQVNDLGSSGPPPSISPASATHANTSGASGSSKLTYRSLLADVIQPQDVKVICAYLVVLSQEAAKTFAEKGNTMKTHAKGQDDIASSSQDGLHGKSETGISESAVAGSPAAEQPVGPNDSNPDDAEASRVRPMSPATLALMCDEQDTMFMADGLSSGSAAHFCAKSNNKPELRNPELYAEKERLILTKFRDCLLRIIQLCDMKEAQYTRARSESLTEEEPIAHGATRYNDNGNSQDPAASNGFQKHIIPPPITEAMTSASATVSNNDPHSKNVDSKRTAG
ncbi:tesmin/TSO1-like CXC 5-like protein [Drosera capensis]